VEIDSNSDFDRWFRRRTKNDSTARVGKRPTNWTAACLRARYCTRFSVWRFLWPKLWGIGAAPRAWARGRERDGRVLTRGTVPKFLLVETLQFKSKKPRVEQTLICSTLGCADWITNPVSVMADFNENDLLNKSS